MNHRIRGHIISFVESKAYGFIKGEDNKKYFFHINDLKDDEKLFIEDGKWVSFEPKANKKGYTVSKLKIENNVELKYRVPDEIYFSKSDSVKGWETISSSDYELFGTSQESPDEAKEHILERAELIGANALINFEYYKRKGEDGNYKYTIHNFRANPIVIGKKDLDGSYEKEDLKIDLDANIEEYKDELEYDPEGSSMFGFVVTLLVIGFFAYNYFFN